MADQDLPIQVEFTEGIKAEASRLIQEELRKLVSIQKQKLMSSVFSYNTKNVAKRLTLIIISFLLAKTTILE